MTKIKDLDFRQRLNWLDPFFYELRSDEIQVTETTGGGKGTITFKLTSRCIMLKIDYGSGDNHTHLKYLKQRQHAEAIILELDDDDQAFKLHIVEMKLTLTADKWREVLRKFEGALYDSLAFMGVLGLVWPQEVWFHVAYTRDTLSTTKIPHATLYKSSPELRQWHQNAVNISWLKDAPLNRIERDPNGNATLPLTAIGSCQVPA